MKSRWLKVFACGFGFMILFLWGDRVSVGDDTCIFGVTPSSVPPNVVLLVDNGAEMEQILWHTGYNVLSDYSPTPGGLAVDGLDNDSDGATDEPDKDDVVLTNGTGSGFFIDNGYAIVKNLGIYYLVPVQPDLTLGDPSSGLAAQSSDTSQHTGTWEIIKGRRITLPAEPSTVVDAQGVQDNAAHFRYSKNYLNWIFFGPYTGDGTDLPDKSRLYEAKKALFTVAKLTANRVNIGVYAFTVSAVGASQVWPLGAVVTTPLADPPEGNTLDSGFVDAVNNITTVTDSPLAEGLASVGGYYATSGVVGFYCQKNFAVVISPGISSQDQAPGVQSVPANLGDFDGDGAGIGEGNILQGGSTVSIPVNQNDGSTYLDDVAEYLYSHDIAAYQDGYQNVVTYTLGFMGDPVSNLFLINTSNNGNGFLNLYDTGDSRYGRYHFSVTSPAQLSATLLETVGDIIARTSTFTAPVIPVTRTLSGNRIYLAFFQTNEGSFWEGSVTKFGVSENREIVDRNGSPATWPNGAIKEDAEPYWATRDWADPAKSNYAPNSTRNIYTYLGSSPDLTAVANAFRIDNGTLTTAVLGNPSHTREQIIEYIRGADVFDEDGDSNTSENRKVITGDVLHSQPAVVHYNFPDGTSTSMVYFGSNDGMLHAVVDDYGTEAWAFIPPDQLHRLKELVEGSVHSFFVDSSPKVYVKDVNANGVIEAGDGDQVLLVCGERKGGTGFFALDITAPLSPRFLWRINQIDDTVNGVGTLPAEAAPRVVSELGQSWAEPQFGLVKTSDVDSAGTEVLFIGGGYSPDNSTGKAVLAIRVSDGSVVRIFKNDGSAITGMNYSFPSAVAVVDTDNNGFVNKVYVGDLGGQMWRLGRFTDTDGNPLGFPQSDENIYNWNAQVLFVSDLGHGRKFFYPPSVALERDFDLVFMGTGDREDACNRTTWDRIYAVKDAHDSSTRTETDLVDVTLPGAPVPELGDETSDVDGNGHVDQGWLIRMEQGEKVLAEGLVFLKAYYVTTFMPNDDPCLPGGRAKLYALGYLTGREVLEFGGTRKRSEEIGGGIPSEPVMVITDRGQTLFVSAGSTNPGADSESTGAGVLAIQPLSPFRNFFYLWWMEQ